LLLLLLFLFVLTISIIKNLQGSAGPTNEGDGSKIVALADLNVFRVGFGDRTDMHTMVRVFQSFEIEPNNACSKVVPLINLAFMVRCNLVTYLTSVRTGLECVTVELSTTGVELEVNPALFSSYKLLELESLVALDKAKMAVGRARFLLNELRGGIGNEKHASKSPMLQRNSMVDLDSLKQKPRSRRLSLTSSMQSILRLNPPSSAPTTKTEHKRSTSAEPGRNPQLSPKQPTLQIFGRTVSFNLVVKIGAGRCALFLVKDGNSFGHARKLYSFEFPQVMLRY
jgi:hypothetical protein